tara:strand:+ start:2489 stop:2695 length:207 start_codon:yes stop_codon:yes gene_type:complete
MDDIILVYVVFGFCGIITGGLALGHVAVWIAKILGFEFEEKPFINTNFMQRMKDGEVLDVDNMFEVKE